MEAPEAHAGAIENDGDEDARHEEKVFSRGVKRDRLTLKTVSTKAAFFTGGPLQSRWFFIRQKTRIYSSPVRFGKSRLAGS
jgi:hypothetical protein